MYLLTGQLIKLLTEDPPRKINQLLIIRIDGSLQLLLWQPLHEHLLLDCIEVSPQLGEERLDGLVKVAPGLLDIVDVAFAVGSKGF
jgi:hypothetical protein